MNTMLLDQEIWDVCLDANGNWAMASDPYSLAQDVACELKTFFAECYYDTSVGIRYKEDILGKLPPISLVRSQMETAALRVVGILTAQCVFDAFSNRQLSGYVLCSTTANQTFKVTF
ncbi:hypothetical protein [Pandoraea terrigena]|uniref:Uncharacterized protein n=1 Tax=Pandoraea terrigena TaxID=2508292 RepID=A0A5E4V8D4_9BURK|nr:hypothetical protein [Pandoraea terrigena]VVE07649.1 hypothetical protein PTE31013_02475 [Pandoraea terrigena]